MLYALEKRNWSNYISQQKGWWVRNPIQLEMYSEFLTINGL